MASVAAEAVRPTATVETAAGAVAAVTVAMLAALVDLEQVAGAAHRLAKTVVLAQAVEHREDKVALPL